MVYERDIYNIPAGAPFLDGLARYILSGDFYDLERLSEVRILLPTRRACRALQHAFLNSQDNRAMILPRFDPLGDVDEEELSLSLAGYDRELSVPPAISPLKRQMLLSRLILARGDFDQGVDRALALASALSSFMDEVYTENLSMADLSKIVPHEFSDHWQVTLEFLEVISDVWPKILAEEGVIDAIDRRNRLLLSLAEFWDKHPPNAPVIAAGVNGSIPATAELLKVISNMPQGCVVLPGLDQDIDDESWNVLEETHPQYVLKSLLQHMHVKRSQVRLWPNLDESAASTPRVQLMREVMRPAKTTKRWIKLSDEGAAIYDKTLSAFDDLQLYECDNEWEEAQLISVLLRETLEDEKRTACLITPDRGLAGRVEAACRRWGIEVDDSAGSSLVRSRLGLLVLQSIHAVNERISPSSLMILLQHPFMRCGLSRAEYLRGVSAFDMSVRGGKPAAGFSGIRAHIESVEHIADDIREEALGFLSAVEGVFASFLNNFIHQSRYSFINVLQAHLKLCEALVRGDIEEEDGSKILWGGVEGQSASAFFSELLRHASQVEELSLDEYEGALNVFMSSVTLRSSFGMNPRVQILGQIESRMVDADLVVLGGLNEGVWPADPAADPWMSRPMRKDFGLAGVESAIGIAAHDFVQGVCAQNVVLTRSMRLGSSPSVPSRWLQRMEAVIEALGQKKSVLLGGMQALNWVRSLDHSDEFNPVLRPEPRPALSARPKRLSVTQVETLLRDPYSIYARSVLKLKALDNIEESVDAAVRGNFVHDAAEIFSKRYPDSLPDNAAQILYDIGHEIAPQYAKDEAQWGLWMPRFERLCHWFIAREKLWRGQGARSLAHEVKGEVQISPDFVLSGRADRIDRLADGSAALIDYKSGGSFSISALKKGELPQLPLEALMLSKGGFKGLKASESSVLSYWVMSGGREPGKLFELSKGVEELVEQIETNLSELIERFEDVQTPYLSLPRTEQAPRFNDYLHLARVQEWAALDDGDDNFGEAV